LLIIFDLDDTLIDTSGCVTPFKLKQTLERLIELGVEVPSFSDAYRELLDKNRNALKSTDAFSLFAQSYGANKEQIATSLLEMKSLLPDGFSVSMTPHAHSILEHYKAICPLAIVTGGYPPFQRDKLKKAGIDTSFFSMIAIPEDLVKKPCYQALQKQFSLASHEIWVCGDRVEMDLKPAFELGFKTVHMRWGRGALQTEQWVDYSIKDLSELKEIIK
jgi:FMN phosphatase YigB (HAD superfamily)